MASNNTPVAKNDEQEAISLLDLALVLAAHKKPIARVCAAVAVLATLVAFLLPKWYTTTAKLMPPQQSQSSAAALLGQLGSLTGGLSSQVAGLKNPSDVYVAILKSGTVADALIKRFDLKKDYDEDEILEIRN